MGSEITLLVGALAASYPNTEVTDETYKVYGRMLEDIPIDVLTQSVEQCIAESKFFPTIAELRDKAFVLMSDVSLMPTSAEAWELVIKEIGRRGFYRSPEFDNPIVAKAVECLGWRQLCTSENGVADRAHFMKTYEVLLERAIRDAKLLPNTRRLLQQPQTRFITIGTRDPDGQ